MIINNTDLKNVYKCNKRIMEYLVYKCHLPMLSFDKDYYYFVNNYRLKEALKKMPLTLKMLSSFK